MDFLQWLHFQEDRHWLLFEGKSIVLNPGSTSKRNLESNVTKVEVEPFEGECIPGRWHPSFCWYPCQSQQFQHTHSSDDHNCSDPTIWKEGKRGRRRERETRKERERGKRGWPKSLTLQPVEPSFWLIVSQGLQCHQLHFLATVLNR